MSHPQAPRWCHASCCLGETETDGPFNAHDAQRLLDQAGMGSGFFGAHHDTILDTLLTAYALGTRSA